MHRAAIILAGLALLAAGCKKTASTTPGETKIGPKGETMLSSQDLARAYAADPEGFDKAFRNKMVIVEGEVTYDKVTETATGREMILLQGYEGGKDSPAIDVRCLKAGSFADDLVGVGPGRKITVRGRVNPTEGMKFLLLTECDLLAK